MKFFVWAMIISVFCGASLMAAETNVFFPIHPEGRTGDFPAQPVFQAPAAGGGGGVSNSENIIPAQSLTGAILTGVITTTGAQVKSGSVVKATSGQNLLAAFNWAKQYNITSLSVYNEEAMYAALTRAELAKMMVKFVSHTDKQLLKDTPCNMNAYKDTLTLSEESRSYITQACELGMMGRKADRSAGLIEFFNPDGKVNRAELATVLSRFLYGSLYENKSASENRYVDHLAALNSKGFILKADDPFMQERQGYVMIIMQRVANSIQKL